MSDTTRNLADALRAILLQVVQGKVLERDACITQAREALAQFERKPDNHAAIIAAAQERHTFFKSEEIEIDEDAELSEADKGTWVQAWVYVPHDETDEQEDGEE